MHIVNATVLALRLLKQLRPELGADNVARMLNMALITLYLCALAELHDRGLTIQPFTTSEGSAEETAVPIDNTSTYMT